MRVDALLEYFRANPHYVDAVIDLGTTDTALRRYIYRIEEDKKAVVLRGGSWKHWLVVPLDRPLAPSAITPLLQGIAKHIYFQLGMLVRKYRIRDGDPNVEEIMKAVKAIEAVEKSVRPLVAREISDMGVFL